MVTLPFCANIARSCRLPPLFLGKYTNSRALKGYKVTFQLFMKIVLVVG